MHAKKAVGRDPTSEVGPELTLDESGHDAVPFSGSRQEGLEGTGEGGVKNGSRGVPGDVLTGRRRWCSRLAHIRRERLIACQ
jgi:hypothetical protein